MQDSDLRYCASVIASQEDQIAFFRQFIDGSQALSVALENRVVEDGDGWQVVDYIPLFTKP